jgi:thymidylate synthase ThyX
LNINSNQDYLSSGEFKGRITYLSFKKESTEEDAKKYHDLMIKKLKHLSVYAGNDITFLIAGCSIETALEFIAHHESRVARLTSSKTRAMSDTLYSKNHP